MRALALAVGLGVASLAAPAAAQTVLPPAAREVDVDEHLGVVLPGDIALRDDHENAVQSGDLFRGDRPTVLVLGYYRCPMLCNVLLEGVGKALAESGYSPGRDYTLVALSIDPDEQPVDAAHKKDALLARLGVKDETGVRFLLGGEREVRAMADAVGFRYAKDPLTNQFAHPALITIVSPGGRISRYLYGINPPVRDLRLSLVEAAEGKIGTIADRVLLTCYRYDPASRRYGPFINGFFRIGALGILITVGSGMGFLFRLERRRNRKLADKSGGTKP
jgi:protein SCO1/2